MADQTMSFAVVHETLVLVHGPFAVDPVEWTAYLTRSTERDFKGIVVIVDQACPGPSARQRTAASDAMKRRGVYPKISVVTPSALTRGIVTVLGWLQRNNLTAFHPNRLEQAFAYAAVPRDAWPSIVITIHELAGRVKAPWVQANVHLVAAAAHS